MIKSKTIILFLFFVIPIIIVNLISCGAEFGQVIISEPDEYRHTYEAAEKVILSATARVFQDKSMGSNVKIDQKNKRVETDYIIRGSWRTRSTASVRKLNWKESEITISVITEKKNETGWEMRRLLEKEQYMNLFETIDLKIYEEMSKVD
ncbi:MAG: hypothetical protein L7F78_07265 [Syntrophales bacterium LBB04]|nr:hypothetical protein [Syntrophales bacterium LBB04]